jgi:undecaprenyl diphosphate synthase
MWPDFAAEDLTAALEEFAARERRFGAVGPEIGERKKAAGATG